MLLLLCPWSSQILPEVRVVLKLQGAVGILPVGKRGFEAGSQTGDYRGKGFHPGGSLSCAESEKKCLKFGQNTSLSC